MATLHGNKINLDDGEVRKLPAAGWRKVRLEDEEFKVNEDTGKAGVGLTFKTLANDPDSPNIVVFGYVPWPTDADKEEKLDDGRTRFGARIDQIRYLSSCLGGPETGTVDASLFRKHVGKTVMANISIDTWEGEERARINLAFGKNIKPA